MLEEEGLKESLEDLAAQSVENARTLVQWCHHPNDLLLRATKEEMI